MSLRFLVPAGLAALLASGAACSTQGKATGSTSTGTMGSTSSGVTGTTTATGTSTGTGGQGGAPAGFCAPATVAMTAVGTAAFEVTTTHYQLYAETTATQAAEMGRLLEAAYPAFQAWFQATPPGSALLSVKFYASEAAWAAGLGADGIVAPSEAGGYYSPTTKTAYLYVQGNPYYDHVLLLHEATHQFHFLSRTKGQSLPFWYAEGHAEYLSRHDWDGHCTRLGVIPLLSWEDMSGQALAESKSPGIDVTAVVSGAPDPTRDASWAVFRYLDTGPNHDGFKAFRDAFDADVTDAAHSFTTLVADPATLSAPLAAWIPGAQEPMKPIFTEWIHVGPGAATGDSPGYFSVAILKEPVTHFETRYDVPAAATWSVGVVLGYQDDKNYQAIVVSADGTLRTFTATAGNAVWNGAGTAPPQAGGEGSVAVDFGAGGAVKLTVNGATSMRMLAGGLPPVGGLAISDTTVSFHDVAWK